MNTLNSIDPGKSYFALAAFEGTTLTSTTLQPRTGIKVFRRSVFTIIEKPWGAQKASFGRDIQELCLSAGQYLGHFDLAEWRACPTIPKAIRHRRALAVLTGAELLLLPNTKEAQGHVLCAVWQGLKELGRL
jgi:hypothetical protein